MNTQLKQYCIIARFTVSVFVKLLNYKQQSKYYRKSYYLTLYSYIIYGLWLATKLCSIYNFNYYLVFGNI
jgi:hypothetical protein